MEYKDYYKILGVSRDASLDEIKKKYRLAAKKYHPDVSKESNCEEKFKEAKEAYEVLKDPEKRRAYDQLGAHWKEGQGFTPPPGWQYAQEGGGPTIFSDVDLGGLGSEFFESLFGRRRGGFHRARGFQQRGEDQHSKISISLEEAYNGTERILSMREPIPGPQPGQVQFHNKQLKVKIPAGVTQGQQIRLSQQGAPGIGGGPPGDLYLEVQIEPHPLFTAEKKDIFLNIAITPWEAALGCKITVPTLSGKVELTVPPGSQSGQKMRLKGRGLPGNPPGDQYVIFKIYVPKPTTEEQKNLYQKMAEMMPFDPRPNM